MNCYFCKGELSPCGNNEQGDFVCSNCKPETYHTFERGEILILTIDKDGRYYDYFPQDPCMIRFYDGNVHLMTHLDNIRVSSSQELEDLGDRYFNLKAFM